MFEPHWFEHSAPTQPLLPQETLSLRRSDSLKRQSLDSRELPREKPQPPKRKSPELPRPTIPRRAASYSNFTELRDDEFSILEARNVPPSLYKLESPAIVEVPLRPKSRNDIISDVECARGIPAKHPRNFTKELDLMRWYGEMEDDLRDAGDDEYKLFLSTIQSQLWTCRHLLDTTDDTLLYLSWLKNSFMEVESQTSSFQTQCENLVKEEQRLETLSLRIGHGLAPYAELESILMRLNRPGTDFVKTRSFADMLKTLDWCLEDLGRYTHFKDTLIYLPRFRRCMTTSMTLIRNFLVSSLRETSADVSKRMAAQNLTETTQSALLYARFRVNAPELRDLVGEIEKRCPGHGEYVSLLGDCYKAFFSSRMPLIVPLTSKKIADITTASSSVDDLVAFARASISDMKSICNDEYELFYAYFSTGEPEVYAFLESICKPLYDRLRQRIVAETQLVRLCELCTLLQTRYIRDQEDSEYDSYDKSQLDFGRLVQSILLETQTRLISGAQAVLKTAIEQFVPTAEDLDYPSRVINQPKTKGISAPIVVETDENLGTTGEFDTDAVFPGWYPTLRKAVWLLSRIYRLVNPAVFGDIAHKVVHSCTLSLIKASNELNQRKTPVDGYLFLIKHLLILKEQIVAFDIEYLPPYQEKTDTQETLTGTFWDIYQKGGLFTRHGILKLVSVGAGWTGGPVENMIDAKMELDSTLRTAITSFTADYSARMLAPVVSYSLTEPSAAPYSSNGSSIMNANWQPQIPPSGASPTLSVRSQSSKRVLLSSVVRPSTPLPPAPILVVTPTRQLTGKSGDQLMQEIQNNIEHEVRDLRARLQEYAVGDWRTKEALVGAVQELVISKYESFFSQLLQDISDPTNNIGITLYRDMWDAKKFVEWSNNVFRVGKASLGEDEHGVEREISIDGEEDDGSIGDEAISGIEG